MKRVWCRAESEMFRHSFFSVISMVDCWHIMESNIGSILFAIFAIRLSYLKNRCEKHVQMVTKRYRCKK